MTFHRVLEASALETCFRVVFRYTFCMVQLVASIDDELVAHIDDMIAQGEVQSRSDAVRRGLQALVSRHQRQQIANTIIEGYQNQPQTSEEVGWADEDTIAMISEESW